MGSEWRTAKFSDLCDICRGGSPRPIHEWIASNGIPWVKIADATAAHSRFVERTKEFIRPEGRKKSREVVPGDLLVSNSATPGMPMFMAINACIHDGWLLLRNFKGIDKLFCYYLLLHERTNIVRQGTGSVFTNLKTDILKNHVVKIPPLPEQQAIACILGALDDKIELNRRMNQTLEAMARAIFKSWFIDFDPVIDNALRAGNPIPESMRERAEVRRRTLDQNQPSPLSPLPKGEGGKKRVNYHGGFDFTGLVEIARELRKKQTPAEAVMWALLRDRRFLGLKFRRQHQIGEYVADFFCHERHLVVELDGPVHEAKKKKDHKRDAYLKSLGFTVLRFPNEQVLDDPASVLDQIAAQCSETGSGSSPSGRGGGEGVYDLVRAKAEGRQPPGLGPHIADLFPDSFQESEAGDIPEGWRVTPLAAMVELISGGTPKRSESRYWGGDIPWFSVRDVPLESDIFVLRTQEHITKVGVENSAAKVLPEGTTIITARGTVGKLALAGVPMAMNQSCYGVRGRDGYGDYFSYFNLCRMVATLQQRTHGSVFDTITRDTFNTVLVVAPPIAVAHGYDELVSPLLERIKSNGFATLTLASIRDTLLPGLISGELRVLDAERIVGRCV